MVFRDILAVITASVATMFSPAAISQESQNEPQNDKSEDKKGIENKQEQG